MSALANCKKTAFLKTQRSPLYLPVSYISIVTALFQHHFDSLNYVFYRPVIFFEKLFISENKKKFFNQKTCLQRYQHFQRQHRSPLASVGVFLLLLSGRNKNYKILFKNVNNSCYYY